MRISDWSSDVCSSDLAFGGSDADGRWSMRDAYDALEAAQASDTLMSDDDPNGDCAPEDEFADILAFEKALPTQTYRSEHQVDMQQFSTPAARSWLAARAAAITAEDQEWKSTSMNSRKQCANRMPSCA